MTDTIGPASKKQEMFLNCDAQMIIYGGAAGSGKTHVSLMRHLRFIDDPQYKGFVFRKESTTIMKEGGIFGEASELYSKVDKGVRIKLKDQKAVFSSKATVSFSGYENDLIGKEKVRGLQFGCASIDEATQFSEEAVFWIFSRLRSSGKHKGLIWLTLNPDPDSWALKYVLPYLYPVGHEFAGRPNPDMDGVIRWFVRRAGDLVWADTREELVALYGEASKPISFTFISGTIADNPPLLKNNPEYLASLLALPSVEKERMLYGNWFARQESSGFFKRQWVEEVDEVPRDQIIKTVRAWDIAGTLPSDVEPDPDYTAGVKMSKLKDGSYLIWDVVRFRARYGDVTNRIIKIAEEDGSGVDILIPQDPGAAGKAAAGHMVQQIIEAGFFARKRPTNKSKVERFRPFAASAENGRIKVLKNCGTDLDYKNFENNDFFYKEMEQFNGGRKGHDDVCDATSDCFIVLSTAGGVPIFSPPSFTQTNPFIRT